MEISGSFPVPYGQVVSLKCGSSNFIGSNVTCFGCSTYSTVITVVCPGNSHYLEEISQMVSGQNATGQNTAGQNATLPKTDKMPQCKWCNKDTAKVLQGCDKSVTGV